ncbi:unnamed protein product, partial [Mesorhabditis belari]|uniref:Innexin n=1 Tax=Mesorhabditis belari TaxID=2138241 RepID=A0AAF3EHD2_9BILA
MINAFPFDYVKGFFRRAPVGDLIDHLHHTVLPSILFIFFLMISAKQWVGTPIQCWLPKEFSSEWGQYAENYCFIHGTYYAPISVDHRITPEEKKENFAGYYQWVPLFLLLSGCFFYLPFFIYQEVVRKLAGIDIQKCTEESITIKNANLKDRSQMIETLVNDFDEQLRARSEQRKGSRAVYLYILLKLAFIVNLCAQLWHMNFFLGHESLWAIWSAADIIQGEDSSHKGYFPRVTFCDFKIRDLGNNRPYSVQCVLMINALNEKVYLLLWSIYVLLLAVTFLNFLYTIYHYFACNSLANYMKSMLMESATKESNEEFDVNEIQYYTYYNLGREALLALHLIEVHTDRRLCALINKGLYDRFCKTKKPGDVKIGAILTINEKLNQSTSISSINVISMINNSLHANNEKLKQSQSINYIPRIWINDRQKEAKKLDHCKIV